MFPAVFICGIQSAIWRIRRKPAADGGACAAGEQPGGVGRDGLGAGGAWGLGGRGSDADWSRDALEEK